MFSNYAPFSSDSEKNESFEAMIHILMCLTFNGAVFINEINEWVDAYCLNTICILQSHIAETHQNGN